MRSARVLLSLYTAATALAAPVRPRPAAAVLVSSHTEAVVAADSSSSQPIGHQPPITVTLEGSRTVVLGPDYHRLTHEERGESEEETIDNRPVPSPSLNDLQPALAVLSSARPLTTDYLLALSRLQAERAKAQQKAAARPEPLQPREMPVGSLVAPGPGPADAAQHAQHVVAQMGDLPAAGLRLGRPCAAQSGDVWIVTPALAFVMVCLLSVVWAPVSRRVRRLLGCEGAICLEDDERTVGGRITSFRDPDMEFPERRNEKQEEQGGDDEDEDEDEDSGAEPWAL